MPTPTPKADPRGPDAGWHTQAACAGLPTDNWYPPRGQPGTLARQICWGCPVRFECLDETMKAEADLAANYRYGIFGGLGPQQRTRLARGDRSVLAIPTFPCGHRRTTENSIHVYSHKRATCGVCAVAA